MAIRLRTVDGKRVALCAANFKEKPGDLYLDDADHYAIATKFYQDEMLSHDKEFAATMDRAMIAEGIVCEYREIYGDI